MTEYSDRATIICPEAHMAKVNALALVIGESQSDGETLRSADWQDAEGNRYAVACAQVKPNFFAAAVLTDQAEAEAAGADWSLVEAAQPLIHIGTLESPVEAALDKLVVIATDNDKAQIRAALDAAGITRAPAA